MIGTARDLNFRNRDPRAGFKIASINTKEDTAKSSNDMGSSLVVEADKFLEAARDSYGRLAGERDGMQARKEDFNQRIGDQVNDRVQGWAAHVISRKSTIFGSSNVYVASILFPTSLPFFPVAIFCLMPYR